MLGDSNSENTLKTELIEDCMIGVNNNIINLLS